MYKRLFGIALPIALQHMTIAANSLLDNFMVGRLSMEAVAATGSANTFMSIARITMFGIASGNSILTTQYYVNNNSKGVGRAFVVNVLLSLLFSAAFFLYYTIFKESIVANFSQDVVVRELATKYLDISIFAIFALSFLYPLIGSLRARSIVNFPFVMSTAALLINGTLNYLLIFGNYGFPRLGVAGAAIATLISEVSVTIIGMVGSIKMGHKAIERLEHITSLPFSFVSRYVSLTIPIVLSNFLWSFFMLKMHNIFGLVNKESLAAFGVLSPVQMVVSHLFSGFGNAALVILGTELGKSSFDEAYKKAKDISYLASFLAAIVGSLVFLASPRIASIYTTLTPEARGYLANLIGIFGLFLWVRVFNSISLHGIFRSGGDSVFIFLSVATTSWLITLPLAYFGFKLLNWGPVQIYWAINFVDVLLAVIFVLRFRSRRWMRNLSEKEEK